MISFLLFLCIFCTTHISSQLFQSPSHFYAINNFSLKNLKRSSDMDENIDQIATNSRIGRTLIDQRTQLTQLNRLLKKPIFNFANLFRRN